MLAITITSIFMWIRAGMHGHKAASTPYHVTPVAIVVSTRRLLPTCECYLCYLETEHYNFARRNRHPGDNDES